MKRAHSTKKPRLVRGFLFLASALLVLLTSTSDATLLMISGPRHIASESVGITDGESVTITGSGFGTNVVTQDFLGGVGNAIESASNATLFGELGYINWADSDSAAHVNTTRAYTRTKSLRVVYPTFNAFGLVRNFGAYKSIYTRQLIYLDSGETTTGQIKINRYVGVPDAVIDVHGDGGSNSVHEDGRIPNTLLHDFWGGPGAYLTIQATGHPGDEPGFSANSLLQFNKWVLLETLFTPDSTAGAGDGTFQIRTVDPDDYSTVYGSQTIGPRVFWGGSDAAYEWLVVQLYIGNEMQQTGVAVYLDPEQYIAANAAGTSVKFILMCNASTYSASTQCSICQHTSWSDTSITFSANKGKLSSLDNGSAWAYPMSAINTPISNDGYTPSN